MNKFKYIGFLKLLKARQKHTTSNNFSILIGYSIANILNVLSQITCSTNILKFEILKIFNSLLIFSEGVIRAALLLPGGDA